MKTEIVYYPECECLHTDSVESDYCLKRFILVDDYYAKKQYYIAICNTWLRLKLNQERINNGQIKYPYYKNHVEYLDIIKEVISFMTNYKEFNRYYFNPYWGVKNTLFQDIVNIPVCEKPNINTSMKLIDALYLLYQDDLPASLRLKLSNTCANTINYNIDRILKYAKYKKHWDMADILKKGKITGKSGLKFNSLKSCLYCRNENYIHELINFMSDIVISYN